MIKSIVKYHGKIILAYKAWYSEGAYRMEVVMKASEFIKHVLISVLSTLFLAALFRPLCMGNGECDYLKLWLFVGIPFGIHRMFLWIVPKGYDIGGSMGILAINLFIGGVIGGGALTWRLAVAAAYLVRTMATGIIWIIRKAAGKPCGVL